MFVGIICFCCAEKQTPIDNFGTETEIQWKSVQELEGLEVHQIIKHDKTLYLAAINPEIPFNGIIYTTETGTGGVFYCEV